MHDYAVSSGDQIWLQMHWTDISRGVQYIIHSLDPITKLQHQTQLNDWGRQGTGGCNSALNALNYRALTLIASLAQDSILTPAWSTAAKELKQAYNSILWDSAAGLYRDNETTSLHPQDGNAMALLFNLTMSASQASAISEGLTRNWNDIGPVTPELQDTISPFVSGLEVLAHFRAGQPKRALELTERLYGYLLDSPLMTGSTLAEGITANGSLYYRATAGYNYDASYTSLSHGWSTAPVQAMINEMLGLQITSFAGKTWTLSPQLAGLTHLQGGFKTTLGSFDAKLHVMEGGKRLEIQLYTPANTTGAVTIPSGWEAIEINGEVCDGNVHDIGGGNSTIVLTK